MSIRQLHMTLCVEFSLRFGNVAEKQRLLAATQSGSIFLLDVPNPDAPVLSCSDFMSTSLGKFRVGSKDEAHLAKVGCASLLPSSLPPSLPSLCPVLAEWHKLVGTAYMVGDHINAESFK